MPESAFHCYKRHIVCPRILDLRENAALVFVRPDEPMIADNIHYLNELAGICSVPIFFLYDYKLPLGLLNFLLLLHVVSFDLLNFSISLLTSSSLQSSLLMKNVTTLAKNMTPLTTMAATPTIAATAKASKLNARTGIIIAKFTDKAMPAMINAEAKANNATAPSKIHWSVFKI
jgi:hypothetical protein